MKRRCTVPMWAAKVGYIVMSLLFMAAGIGLMLRPGISAVLLGRVFGAGMILFGTIKLVGYFSRDLYRLAFQFDIEFGILLIVLGLIVLVRPRDVMNFLFIAIGVAALADGLFKTQIAFDSRRFGIGSWGVILVLALLTAAVGLALMFRPWESAELMTGLLGAAVTAEGLVNLCVAVTTVKVVDHQWPDDADVIDADDVRLHRLG